MLLKDYKPKYKTIELIESQDEFSSIKSMHVIRIDKAIKRYGNREVMSVKDYGDTKTTSIIISEFDKEGMKC